MQRLDTAADGFLACRIGGHLLAVPLAHVVRLLDYGRGSAPPLAQPWFGGIAQDGTSLFPSLALAARSSGARQGKGLLLSAGDLQFALEVDEVEGLLRLDAVAAEGSPDSSPAGAWCCPREWLAPAPTADGVILDVGAVARDLRADDGRLAGRFGA